MQKFLSLLLIAGFAAAAPAQDVSPRDTLFDIFARLCVKMLPEHGDSTRMPEPFPVTIIRTPDQTVYAPGQQILVTLRGAPGFNFTGFLIQARQPGDTVPHGHWAPGAGATVVGCRYPQPDFSGDDTGAHQTGSIRNVQEMVFTMPTEIGRYIFELTTVERFGVYWMNQFSSRFTVL